MLVAQAPSGAAAVVATWVQAVPAVVYSTPSGAPAGEEPSAKRSWPETRAGLRALLAGGLDRDAETGERVAGGAGAQVGELRVERVARAGGLVGVAVAADALEHDRRAAG